MTVTEAVFVILLLMMLAAILLPALAAKKLKAQRISCTDHLKQIALAFQIWENDHNGKYPMNVSITNGGAMEPAIKGNTMAIFQVMSNELSTPIILICPQDEQSLAATNFDLPLNRKNVSYFINLDCNKANPQDFLSGDDNFEINRNPIKSGLLEVSSNTPITWSAARHKFSGNLAIADGSAQEMNNPRLAGWLRSTNPTDMRLAIP